MIGNVDLTKDPYGLGSGTLISGSSEVGDLNGFWYYPILESSASIITDNITGGEVSGTFAAGLSVYCHITAVSQSSGYSIVYNAQEDNS